jgi:hypothetical protein
VADFTSKVAFFFFFPNADLEKAVWVFPGKGDQRKREWSVEDTGKKKLEVNGPWHSSSKGKGLVKLLGQKLPGTHSVSLHPHLIEPLCN